MKSYRIGNTSIGKFESARAAATFHCGTEAVLFLGNDQWLCVLGGERFTVTASL